MKDEKPAHWRRLLFLLTILEAVVDLDGDTIATLRLGLEVVDFACLDEKRAGHIS
jgi:hypothetical protein